MFGDEASAISDRNRSAGVLDGLSRYDVALAIIPLALLCSLFAGRLLATSAVPVLAVGATVCAAVVVDGMFLHPPRPRS